jgi:hypothetical protein
MKMHLEIHITVANVEMLVNQARNPTRERCSGNHETFSLQACVFPRTNCLLNNRNMCLCTKEDIAENKRAWCN